MPTSIEIGPQDVLTLKGSAAQNTKHEGNLAFYAICESRYGEYSGLDVRDPRRKQICHEIVEEVHSNGGIFRGRDLKEMDKDKALRKVADRMGQISKPKKVVDSSMIGENDVVFANGSRNHLYTGNTALRELCDAAKEEYWAIGPSHNGLKRELAESIAQKIYDKGGVFRDNQSRLLSKKSAVEKIQGRMRDLKKMERKRRERGVSNPASTEHYRSGCTSTKSIVLMKEGTKGTEIQSDGEAPLSSDENEETNKSTGSTLSTKRKTNDKPINGNTEDGPQLKKVQRKKNTIKSSKKQTSSDDPSTEQTDQEISADVCLSSQKILQTQYFWGEGDLVYKFNEEDVERTAEV